MSLAQQKTYVIESSSNIIGDGELVPYVPRKKNYKLVVELSFNM